MTASLDSGTLLRVFAWARLAVAACLIGVGPWAPPIFVPTVSAGLPRAVFLLVVLSSGALLALGPPPRPRSVAWLLCLLDATLVTAVVSATGGPRSVLVFLYVLLVTAASVLLSRQGAVAIAGVSSTLYAGLVFMRSFAPVVAFGAPVDDTTALDFLAIFVNSTTLVIVAFVAGGLAERFLQSERELERQRRSLGDARAFRDVVFQSARTGLVALDRDHRVTAFNPAAATLTGVPARAALGARWIDLFGPELPLREIEATIARDPRASTLHETELTGRDGARVPLRVTGSALEAGDGTRLGLLIACEDLTSVRAMEARIRQADRLATVGRMAANIAHEIRNPLTALRGAAESLASETLPAELRHRLTEIVQRESDRLDEVVANFVDYACPAPLVVEPIDAARVIEDVLAALAERPESLEIKIIRAGPPSLPIEADRARLRRALWTLCLNAVEAMPGGGELRVGGRVRAGMVELSVTDTGPGIPPEELPHVFEPFFAARHATRGPGLALVHRVVDEHGGDVTVRSERGLGAEFTLRLPERHA